MKIKANLYRHKIPAVVLAGFPYFDANAGKYTPPALQSSVFGSVLAGIGISPTDILNASISQDIFQAFCARFIGRELSQKLFKDLTKTAYDIQFFASEFGAVFENTNAGTNIAPYSPTEQVRATTYLASNGVELRDIVNFFAPVRARHPRLRDEILEFNTGALVGIEEAETRNRTESNTGNSETNGDSVEKFNGISPTTERANSRVETGESATSSNNVEASETVSKKISNGLEQKKEIEALAGIRNPIDAVMDEIALLFDDEFLCPINKYAGALEFDGERGGELQ